VLGQSSKVAEYISHCRETGIEVLPPDINLSGTDFTVVGNGLRYGLAGIKNVGRGFVDKLARERAEKGPFKGLEDFSHIWIIWGFSEIDKEWSPTVRPPRLGGNKRVGVFATRSPFRPNGLGLSCVKLEKALKDKYGIKE
jgi:hypothetical protein